MEKQNEMYLVKPLNLISDQLTYKGDYSFIHYLKKMYYGTELKIRKISLNQNLLYCAEFYLTNSGLLNINDIIRNFFSYLKNVKKNTVTKEKYTEMQRISIIRNKYHQPFQTTEEYLI